VIQPLQWNIFQIVTVIGVDYFVADENQSITIPVRPTSTDLKYNNMIVKINVTNMDNDVPVIPQQWHDH